ncbi:NAD(P)H-binding protein [Sphaerisporangium fuscum]|uniref:NAD(P)H-binding protein n=1 Tax=Sphaerisporangium fuscum TaxID=2835868 RepID=UPI001BDC35B6|nr:NAD(P)H-binding protein [Sphaerisporangium fuscum]
MTGATGNVGRRVLARLLSENVTVRALVRTATAELPPRVEVAAGDLADPAGLEDPLRDVDAVFLVWPFLTADGADQVVKAIAHRARRLVYLSSAGVADDARRQGDPINQMHADLERLIAETGVAATVLRADTIASNARGWIGQVRAGDVVRGPDIAGTAVVHEDDIAEVAARVLTDDRHAGGTHVLTGPQVLSRADQVRLLGEALERPLRFQPVPAEEARRQMLADGRPPALVEALLAATARPRSELTTDTVERITGAPARGFAQWAREHAGEFR